MSDATHPPQFAPFVSARAESHVRGENSHIQRAWAWLKMAASENLDARDVRGNWLDNRLLTTLLSGAIGGAFAAGVVYATMRADIATGVRGYELALQNKAAIQNDLAALKLQIAKGFQGVKISTGKIVANNVRKLTAAQAETSKAVAVQAERVKHLEQTFRDWRIREAGP